MADEAAKLHEIVRLEIAERRAAKGDEDRRGAFLEQRGEGHDAVKILRLEPVGVKLLRRKSAFGIAIWSVRGSRPQLAAFAALALRADAPDNDYRLARKT